MLGNLDTVNVANNEKHDGDNFEEVFEFSATHGARLRGNNH